MIGVVIVLAVVIYILACLSAFLVWEYEEDFDGKRNH